MSTQVPYTYEFAGLDDGKHVPFKTLHSEIPLHHIQINGVVKLAARKVPGKTETWTITHVCVAPRLGVNDLIVGQVTQVLCVPRSVFE